MRTEDAVARDLRQGAMTVDQALAEFKAGVLVYAASGLNPDEMMWEDVEDAASGSSDLFPALALAGATPEQMDAVGAEVQRLREAGSTVESRF